MYKTHKSKREKNFKPIVCLRCSIVSLVPIVSTFRHLNRIALNYYVDDYFPGLPPDDAVFCRGKMDGWYSQPTHGYTQCVDGRQVTVRYCLGLWYGDRGGNHYQQCMFCSSSCTCQLECTADHVMEPDHKARK